MKKIQIISLSILVLILLFYIISSRNATNSPSLTTPTNTSVTPVVTGNSVQLGTSVPFNLTVPTGFHIGIYAKDLGNPRDLELTDGGTILVSSPNSNTVIALYDENNDGVAEQKIAVRGENVVHGLAMHNGKLYVAEKNSVKRYSWNEADKTATFEKKLLDLPGSQNHIYRTLVFGNDNKMYISIGSNCNVCVESNPWVGTVIVANEDGTNPKVFAKGQRNAPFLAVNPNTGAIWATGMGRDYLGDNLPPDEINILKNGGDYGWPNCYGNKVHDTNFDTKQYIQDPCKDTIAPIFEIPAHSAPLGLAFIPSSINTVWAGDLLVAYHGSWNRSTKTGYKVVKMNVEGNRITGVEDFITGFLDGNTVHARPVDLLFDKKANLYISDDKSGYVFVVSRKG